MSKDNNIREISSRIKPQDTKSITLDEVIQALQNWRLIKTHRNERIPEIIWDQIFMLVEKIPYRTVIRAAGITQNQFHLEKTAREENTQSLNKTVDQGASAVNFCEVQPIPLAYKPAKAFDTSTSVVEFYRADGALMKIHLCTDRFHELLNAFFAGK